MQRSPSTQPSTRPRPGRSSNAASLVVPSDFTSLGPLPAPVDTAEIDHVSDLVVTKTDHTDSVTSGTTTTYEIVITNLGPSDAVAANVSDPVPDGLAAFAWTCTGSNGGVCRDPSGTGSLNTSIDVPVDGTVTFLAHGDRDGSVGHGREHRVGSGGRRSGLRARRRRRSRSGVPQQAIDPVTVNNVAVDVNTVVPVVGPPVTVPESTTTTTTTTSLAVQPPPPPHAATHGLAVLVPPRSDCGQY